MSREVQRRLRSVFWNETGQMSVFIALIFQVLFVFFAMIVNIGLLVHDKINLQNAVDLGAYYAAQRQAEILNEIAHINYQMRQDWKLLVWRYRVLGSMGNPTIRPIIESGAGVGETAVNEAEARFCVTHPAWYEYFPSDRQPTDLCNKTTGYTYPKVPSVQIIAPWIPGLGAAAASAQLAQAAQRSNFNDARPMNAAFAMAVYGAYKGTMAIRKQMIRALRAKLVEQNPTDLNNESIYAGVQKTISKNVTEANRADLNVQLINGLDHEPCDRPEMVLPEVPAAPLFIVTTVTADGSTGYDTHLNAIGNLVGSRWDPTEMLKRTVGAEPPINHPLFPTLGFEKNPWCMVYVGVKATSKPRKPFSPLGEPVQLVARSFAQPFGGRVGPWYSSQWPRGGATSQGGEPVDALVPPRTAPESSYAITSYANYSRFPGDTLGLKSRQAIAAQRHLLGTLYGSHQMYLGWYFNFLNSTIQGDPMVWMGDKDLADTQPLKNLRLAEIAAVTPDLFDITYYSIDPNYQQAYLNPQTGFGTARFLGKIENVYVNDEPKLPISDLGSHRESPQLAALNIKTQIETALGASQGATQGQSGFSDGNIPFWIVKAWSHVLTGWAPNRALGYEFPDQRFGQCPDQGRAIGTSVPIPGGCFAGGRTGYSVRLLSREHLLGAWKVGGDGGPAAPILNPPGTEF